MLSTACCKCFKTNKKLIKKYITFSALWTVDWRFICDFLVVECAWICKINELFLWCSVDTKKRGRPSVTRAPVVFDDVRYDGVDHLIRQRPQQRRCQMELCTGKPTYYCGKCNVTLCPACFYPYHTRWCLCRTMPSCRITLCLIVFFAELKSSYTVISISADSYSINSSTDNLRSPNDSYRSFFLRISVKKTSVLQHSVSSK